jgi:hypothetical protein
MSTPRDVCPLHSGIEEDMHEIKAILSRIEARVNAIAVLEVRVAYLEKVVHPVLRLALLGIVGAVLALVLK